MSRLKFRLLAGAGVSLLVCTAGRAQTPAKPESSEAKAGVAAMIGGKPVTMQELDEKVLKKNMKLAQQLYDARRAAIDEIILDRALGGEAATRGVTVDKLVQERVTAKATPVTEADISNYYEGNKARMSGKTLEQVSAQIKGMLVSQRETEARNAIIAEIKSKAEVKVVMDAPRVEIAVAANEPAKGPATAKVTIIEFSDFQ
jgi:hypothetical protein